MSLNLTGAPVQPASVPGLDRPILTLGEVSELLETHPRTLMMYEHLGLIRPGRTPGNRRLYSQRDLLKLRAIQALTRGHGVNLAGVRLILPLLKTLQDHGLRAPEGLGEIDARLLDL